MASKGNISKNYPSKEQGLEFRRHIESESNPHNVTAEQLKDTVDIREVTTITAGQGAGEITEDGIYQNPNLAANLAGQINVTGNVEIEAVCVTENDTGEVYLTINGDTYTANASNDTKISFKGDVKQPIEFFVEHQTGMRFDKFVIDNELEKRVAEVEKALGEKANIKDVVTKEEFEATMYPVDLTEVAKATDGTAEITGNSITPLTAGSGGVFIAGIIDISGYVEIEAENTRADYVTLIINGERYVAIKYDDNSISFKGYVNEPIGFEVESTATLTFTKFVTATDYELHNKVSEIDEKVSNLEDVCIGDADLVEITIIDNGNAGVTNDTITCIDDIKYTLNVTGYVEIEATTRYENHSLIINDVRYANNISFKGIVTKPITGSASLPGDYVKFSKFKVSKIDALEKQVGDFDAALDAAIALCDKYIGGEIE